jgi:hypothetical protein
MRHAGLVAFLLVIPGCIHSADPPETNSPAAVGPARGAGGAIMSALPSNLTLAFLRPGTEMALLAAVDGNAVLINTGPAQDSLLTDWVTRVGVRQVSLLLITDLTTPFSGGCSQLAFQVEVALVVAPAGIQCEGAPAARTLDSLRPGQVLQVGHISIGIVNVEPLVATLDYGAVRILVAPTPACPTLTRLSAEGLAAPDLLQLAQTSLCQAWEPPPRTVAFASASSPASHVDPLGTGEAITFTSDGTTLHRRI